MKVSITAIKHKKLAFIFQVSAGLVGSAINIDLRMLYDSHDGAQPCCYHGCSGLELRSVQ